MEKTAKKTEQKPLGVFQALSSGFELIGRNPWILLVPIALDTFLWLGPQVSARALLRQALAQLPQWMAADAPADARQNIAALQTVLQTLGDSMNVLGILATGMPTVIGLQPPAANLPRAQFFLDDVFALGGLMLALCGGAVLLASGYLELIARPVRREVSARAFLPSWLGASLNLFWLIVLVVGGVTVLLIPVTLLAVMFSLLSQALGSLLLVGGMMVVFWALLYLVFAVPAVFVSRVGAPQALLNSVSIFRFDFWSAIGLVFIVYLLHSGFAVIWQLFETNAWGVVFIVIANAFLSSALVAAQMIFYNDRMSWLVAARAHKTAGGEKQ